MTKSRLIARINTCQGQAERNEKWANRYYALYKNGGSQKDYQYAQNFYAERDRNLMLVAEYRRMLACGEYE